MQYKTITKWGELKAPLRNIIMRIDGTSLMLELIPELISKEKYKADDEQDKVLLGLLGDSYEILEADTKLSLKFDHILAVAVDADIDVDIFGGLQKGWQDAPRLGSKKSFYPLLEILNSGWKSQLPDYCGGDSPDIHHIRAISGECSFDVLGLYPVGEWLKNS